METQQVMCGRPVCVFFTIPDFAPSCECVVIIFSYCHSVVRSKRLRVRVRNVWKKDIFN